VADSLCGHTGIIGVQEWIQGINSGEVDGKGVVKYHINGLVRCSRSWHLKFIPLLPVIAPSPTSCGSVDSYNRGGGCKYAAYF